jgi:hypothetical protein
MIDLDPILQQAIAGGRTSLDLPLDTYSTKPVLEWEVDNSRRLPSDFDLNGQGSTLILDTSRVTEDMLRVEAPLHMISSQIRWAEGKSGQELLDAVPRNQSVRNFKFVAQHSVLSPYAKSLNVSLRITAACLQGHNALIENPQTIDFGVMRKGDSPIEAFPLVITGVLDGLDRYAMRNVPEGFAFEPAKIVNPEFLGFVPTASSFDQVSFSMIIGGTCPGEIGDPWKELPPWRQIMRKNAQILNPKVTAPGKNIVQACTIYQCLEGLIDGAKTDGAIIGVYGDYLSTKKLHITANNSFKNGVWGVAFRLSPSTAGVQGLAEQFSHEDYIIEKFESNATAGDVYLNVDPMPDGSFPPTRYIRNIAVDERLRIVNEGNRAGVVKIPSPDTKKGGCRNPFKG